VPRQQCHRYCRIACHTPNQTKRVDRTNQSTSRQFAVHPTTGRLFQVSFCIFAVNEYLIIKCECRYQRQESSEEKTNQKPHFIRPLQDLGELQEGRNAHFEAQLTPVSDPTMKVRLHQTSFFLTAPNTINTRWSGTKMDDRSPPVAGLLPSSTSATCLSI